jgi:poly-gamma-glutamate synthase PgsB/CapB
VARYIAAGMRAGGFNTVAKTTGTSPVYINNDGSQTEIKRKGPPRVQEQFSIINKAAGQKADCLVLECMSISPELQQLESREFKPHVYVLTNVLDDHRENLGDDPEEQLQAFCQAIPESCLVVTHDGPHYAAVKRHAERQNSDSVTAEIEEEFEENTLPDDVFGANIALAITACRAAGVDPDIAFKAIMKEAVRETVRETKIGEADANTWFVNGFAVNDVASAGNFINRWRNKLDNTRDLIVVLNTRSDRPLRTQSFIDWLVTQENLTHLILLGDHAAYAGRRTVKSGFPADRVMIWNKATIARAKDKLKEMGLIDALVIGLGNIVGDGFRFVEAVGAEDAT